MHGNAFGLAPPAKFSDKTTSLELWIMSQFTDDHFYYP
ncbi:hypothetical protein F0726_02433 [Acidithiobacillus caldus]|nr:hypothetical protein F0726_02433 [Acidithiobacillus caldus]